MLALAKLKLLSPSHSLSPMVTSSVWPFLLKMSFSFRIVRGAYTDLVLASRLFFFQLGQIALNPEPALGNTTRLERALRLVYQRVIRTTRSQAPPLDDDDSFHTLSMFALWVHVHIGWESLCHYLSLSLSILLVWFCLTFRCLRAFLLNFLYGRKTVKKSKITQN